MPPSQKPSPSLNPPSRLDTLFGPARRLYAIVDVEACARAERAPADVARAFFSAGATCLQLRGKSLSSRDFLDLANVVTYEASDAGATVIINDRADVALLSGACGVHVGQEDLSPADARAVVGAGSLVGLSTHTAEQWSAAVTEPISYMAIGPAFGTSTKDTGYNPVGLEVIREASRVAGAHGLPTVAIGGITLENAVSVVDAGAAAVAVITDLLNGDPETRCRAFLRILE
ncbi:MAG TPA: thiamine phosphate synthase [Vicinamibacterales bacterium]|nr:thiamine phosphate synthase [Vicinamibacterales bacterium]